jgi:hypothetical protein
MNLNVMFGCAQWVGLPYGECTWESFQDIARVNCQHRVDEFQARFQPDMRTKATPMSQCLSIPVLYIK